MPAASAGCVPRCLLEPPRLTLRQTKPSTTVDNSHTKEVAQNTTTSTSIRIGSINVQSLKPKLIDLASDLHHLDYDIIAISETWLRPSTPTRLLIIPGYTLHRADRPDNRGYGGVAIATKQSITAAPFKCTSDKCQDSKLETLWAVIKMDRGRQLVIGSVYRPPRHTVSALQADFEDLERQLQQVYAKFPTASTVICGDLNCDLLKAGNDSGRRRLEEFLHDYSLYQSVSSSTYASGSLLDVFIVQRRDNVSDCRTFHCNYSPHDFIRASINIPRARRKPTITRSRCLNRIDLEAFLYDLQTADWCAVFSSGTVRDKWSSFMSMFLPIIDAHAPLREIRIRNPTAPPVSDQTRSLMAQRRATLRQAGRAAPEYRDLNRAVRSAIRRDTRISISSRIREQGAHTVWRNLRAVIGKKGGAQKVEPQVTAEVLNSHFVSVGPRVAAGIAAGGARPAIPCRLPRVGACSLILSPIDLASLYHTIASMRNSPAHAGDGICIRVIKTVLPAIGDVILHIVNSSLTLSEFPDSWKHSIIRPIHKTGDPTDPSNFRPIAIIPVISKVVERVVQKQLYSYLSDNHLLSPSQHGFRPRHSTETALLTITDHLLSATDSGEISLLCLLDLSKAFDVINHDLLLNKLQLHGVDLAWFHSYLHGHTQSVTSGAATSRPLANSMGVFQGSALGPLLFSIFVNDMSSFSEGCVVQYADDTQVLITGKKEELPELISRLERTLTTLDTWFQANGLKVNTSKTQLIAFGSRQNLRSLPSFQVTFRDAAILPVNGVKNMGITFDPHLSWDAHVSNVSRSCIGILVGLSHARHLLPNGIITTLVTALVLPHIRYCISVYGNGTQKNLDKIQKILNFAARTIFGRRKFDHVSDLREALGWLTAHQLTDAATLSMAHKIMATGEPDVLTGAFRTNRSVRARTTRQDELLHVPRSRTEAGKRRFSCRAPSLYNALPPDISQLGTSSFSRAVRAHMLSAATDGGSQ